MAGNPSLVFTSRGEKCVWRDNDVLLYLLIYSSAYQMARYHSLMMLYQLWHSLSVQWVVSVNAVYFLHAVALFCEFEGVFVQSG